MENTSIIEGICKSNNLIESSYYLTVAENRLIYMAAKKLKPIFISSNMTPIEIEKMIMANTFEPIKIDIIDYKREFGIRSNNLYLELKKVTEKLYNRSIQYIDEEGNLVKKRWVITCKYNNDEKNVQIQFHPDLVMDLLIFRNKYTMLNISKSIKNSYTYRLYELLKQYVLLKKRYFTIEDLRYKLAIPDDEYSLYSNFKSRVILPSQKSLNKYSDINISIKENKNKKTRKVEGILFLIKSESPKKVILNNDEQIALNLNEICIDKDEYSAYQKIKHILNINLTPQEANAIFDAILEGIKNNDLNIGALDYLKDKKQVVDIYCKSKSNVNYIGVLISALKGNWSSSKKASGGFTDYEQREYNWNELERKLLGWDKEQ